MNYTYYRRYQKPRRRKKRSQFSSFFWLGVILVILALILKACVSVIGSISKEKQDDLVLTVERGGGEILSFGQSVWEIAPDLGVVLEGDSVQSDEDSYLLLDVHNGPSIRMDEGTYLSFDRVQIDDLGQAVIHLVLHDGRIWYENDTEALNSVVIHTDVMDVSGGKKFLLSNQAENESLYIFEGSSQVDYVDRGLDDVVIESLVLPEKSKSLITSDLEVALLNREAVVLVESMDADELSENEFLQWSLGENRVIELKEPEDLPEEVIVEEETPVEEEETIEELPEEELVEEPVDEFIEPTESLMIQITSPSSGASDDDGAIAIEGVILSGTASSVYVTWSGNGEAYPLGLFEPGNALFRYVADVQYSNFTSGTNSYTITAYDSDGNPSNTVTLDIVGDF